MSPSTCVPLATTERLTTAAAVIAAAAVLKVMAASAASAAANGNESKFFREDKMKHVGILLIAISAGCAPLNPYGSSCSCLVSEDVAIDMCSVGDDGTSNDRGGGGSGGGGSSSEGGSGGVGKD